MKLPTTYLTNLSAQPNHPNHQILLKEINHIYEIQNNVPIQCHSKNYFHYLNINLPTTAEATAIDKALEDAIKMTKYRKPTLSVPILERTPRYRKIYTKIQIIRNIQK